MLTNHITQPFYKVFMLPKVVQMRPAIISLGKKKGARMSLSKKVREVRSVEWVLGLNESLSHGEFKAA